MILLVIDMQKGIVDEELYAYDTFMDRNVRLVEAARENEADIICLSALLTTTMDYMKDIVDAVKASGLNVKVMVGGAPLTSEFAAGIGADGYSSNANEAVAVAKELLAV